MNQETWKSVMFGCLPSLIVCGVGGAIDQLQPAGLQSMTSLMIGLSLAFFFELVSLGYYWFRQSGVQFISWCILFFSLSHNGSILKASSGVSLQAVALIFIYLLVHNSIHIWGAHRFGSSRKP